MRILALDSSGIVATVAIVEDDNLLAEYTVNYGQNPFPDFTSHVGRDRKDDRV